MPTVLPHTRVEHLCRSLTILIENRRQNGINNRPSTIMETVYIRQNIRVKVKQAPSVAASVPVNIGGAKRECVSVDYSGFEGVYTIPIKNSHNTIHTPFMAIYGDGNRRCKNKKTTRRNRLCGLCIGGA